MSPRKKKATTTKKVESVKHRDKRRNIPTEELRDFVKEDEERPKPVLYPRDPSLDPQLVWKGKDEQDRRPLEVPLVPVYIQEKINPHAIIEDLRVGARRRPAQDQEDFADLFADFNGIEFEDLIDFYHHDQNWSNRMILGDSLLVMTSLAEKEGLKGKVQMIYIDPPYGIKFGSNWQVSSRKRDVKDGKLEGVTRQPEQIRAFRDTWELGIHSYLAYLRERISVGRPLLSDSGSLFVQIGVENVHLVRCLLDEVMGPDNFVAMVPFVTTGGQTTQGPAAVTDFVLWYGKDSDSLKYRSLLLPLDKGALPPTISWYVQSPTEDLRALTKHELANPRSLAQGSKVLWLADMLSRSGGRTTQFKITHDGRSFVPTRGGWRTNRAGVDKLQHAHRLHAKGNALLFKRFLDDYPVVPLNALWLDTQMGGFAAKDKVYVVQTHTKVIERCLLMTTDPGDLVLDPTCGSGTTAYVAEQWGRRWITIDTSRVALALARTRLMAARYPYYLLADSPEGVEKEAALTGKTAPSYQTEGDIKKGLVYKRVPHITLKSIANNPEITEGMTRDEIDKAIAKYADTETLYDQPYEDNRKIRVTGPFTVESLSPHRVLSTDEEYPRSEADGKEKSSSNQFEVMIVDNLKKAGVQNMVKDERLKFERLEPFAGEWIQAEGEYADKSGKLKRVAVSIGPEHGTVGPELVKQAAKEALKGVGFDLLVVCGFAFDAHAPEAAEEFAPVRVRRRRAPARTRGPRTDPFAVAEETRQYGKLPVMLARMNPDLAMGDELLKKTGAGNLFMVFGEPDIAIEPAKDDKLTVEIFGVDVYDPTTGQVRSNSTDDIASWFIDTNYNGESFFVRHAYFTGAGDPYDKLKRALKTEIDEAAWATLYRTKSRPFPKPDTGKIAVKVINHYGDEVLKVYDLDQVAAN